MLIHAHIVLAPHKLDGTFVIKPYVIDLPKNKSVIIILKFIKKRSPVSSLTCDHFLSSSIPPVYTTFLSVTDSRSYHSVGLFSIHIVQYLHFSRGTQYGVKVR